MRFSTLTRCQGQAAARADATRWAAERRQELPKPLRRSAAEAFIDSRCSSLILAHVTRLLISMLCALGLAFAPVAANGMSFDQQPMAKCDMQHKMPSKPAHHGKMDCCTPACQVSAAAALQPQLGVADRLTSGKELRVTAAATQLDSFASTGLDPPPRPLS